MTKKNLVLTVSAVLILSFFLGTYAYRQHRVKTLGFMAKENASTFVREHSRSLGPDEAKVYLVEFMDPACETCAAFFPLTKQLMAAHPGKIKLVLRYAPFHPGADQFVKILEAAGKQGKYWETLQVMLASQEYWASHHQPQPEQLWQFLPQAGLDLDRLRSDMNDPAIARLIEQDMADAKTLQVQKTPGFFVNGKPLVSFGYEQLQQLVESEVRAAYPDQ